MTKRRPRCRFHLLYLGRELCREVWRKDIMAEAKELSFGCPEDCPDYGHPVQSAVATAGSFRDAALAQGGDVVARRGRPPPTPLRVRDEIPGLAGAVHVTVAPRGSYIERITMFQGAATPHELGFTLP